MKGSLTQPVVSVDSAANDYVHEVVGNKGDTVAGDSLVSLTKQCATAGSTLNVPQFAGTIYYVDDAGGSDVNAGTSPSLAFETIGAAITAMSDGDAITVKAGTYTEVGLDLSNNAAEMWLEIGAILSPATGIALTVSGDYCRVAGNVTILGVAGSSAMLVSGDGCLSEDVTAIGGSNGIQVTGDGVTLTNTAAGQQSARGYSLEGDRTRLNDCATAGAGASIGYYVSAGAMTGVLRNCTSAGHTTAGFYADAGAATWTFKDCSSGGGDGRWVDVDTANVFSNFTFDDEVFHLTTFTGTGAGSDNLFRVYGTVEFQFIGGDVETVLAGDVGNLKIELYDGAATDVTTVVATASAPSESVFYKTEDSGKALKLYSSASAVIIEKVNLEKSTFGIVAKAGVATYVRATWDGNAASGAIHWHSRWIPITEDGFVEAV